MKNLNVNRGFSVRTHSGAIFDPASGLIDAIDIHDVAHALSHLCRFNGHSREFYSVAEHSCLVSQFIAHKWPDDLEAQYAGLLHDATEAYVGDVTSPLKHLLPNFQELEANVATQLAKHFDIRWSPEIEEKVKIADMAALAVEATILFDDVREWDCVKENPPEKWQSVVAEVSCHDVGYTFTLGIPTPSGVARNIFLNKFNTLRSKLNDKRAHRS